MFIVYFVYFFVVGMLAALHTINFIFAAHDAVVAALLFVVLYLMIRTYLASKLQ